MLGFGRKLMKNAKKMYRRTEELPSPPRENKKWIFLVLFHALKFPVCWSRQTAPGEACLSLVLWHHAERWQDLLKVLPCLGWAGGDPSSRLPGELSWGAGIEQSSPATAKSVSKTLLSALLLSPKLFFPTPRAAMWPRQVAHTGMRRPLALNSTMSH